MTGGVTGLETIEAGLEDVTHFALEARLETAQSSELSWMKAGWSYLRPDDHLSFPDFPGFVVEYRYLWCVHGEPWSLSTATVPLERAPESWDGTHDSFFAALGGGRDTPIRSDERRFRAAVANGIEARLLGLDLGTAIFVFHQVHLDARGRIVAQVVHRVRGDRAEYTVRSLSPSA